MNFDESLKKLEGIVAKMERGDQNLDAMIADFEAGKQLADDCEKELKSIKLKIEKITKSGKSEPFNA